MLFGLLGYPTTRVFYHVDWSTKINIQLPRSVTWLDLGETNYDPCIYIYSLQSFDAEHVITWVMASADHCIYWLFMRFLMTAGLTPFQTNLDACVITYIYSPDPYCSRWARGAAASCSSSTSPSMPSSRRPSVWINSESRMHRNLTCIQWVHTRTAIYTGQVALPRRALFFCCDKKKFNVFQVQFWYGTLGFFFGEPSVYLDTLKFERRRPSYLVGTCFLRTFEAGYLYLFFIFWLMVWRHRSTRSKKA